MKYPQVYAQFHTSSWVKREDSQTHPTRWASQVTACSPPLMMEGAWSLTRRLSFSAGTSTSRCFLSSSLASQPPILYIDSIDYNLRHMTKSLNSQFKMMIKIHRRIMMSRYLIIRIIMIILLKIYNWISMTSLSTIRILSNRRLNIQQDKR